MKNYIIYVLAKETKYNFMFTTKITNLIIVNHMATIMAYSKLRIWQDVLCKLPFFLLFLNLWWFFQPLVLRTWWFFQPLVLRTIQPLLKTTLHHWIQLNNVTLVHGTYSSIFQHIHFALTSCLFGHTNPNVFSGFITARSPQSHRGGSSSRLTAAKCFS